MSLDECAWKLALSKSTKHRRKNLPVWGLELQSANSQVLTIITEPKYSVVASTAWPLWLLVFGVSIPKRDAHTYIYIYATQNGVPIMCLALRRSATSLDSSKIGTYDLYAFRDNL